MRKKSKNSTGGAAVKTRTLVNGDHLSQAEFHSRYQHFPNDSKWELIGGIVYMASPLRRAHALYDEELSYALGTYRRATPGVELLPNVTTILSDDSEPQPDLCLRILSEYGGRSRENIDEYIEGAPEFISEIAYSTRAIDLHRKKRDYQRARVREYLVVCIEEGALRWFRFPKGEIKPDERGVYRSRVFPGFWLDGPALLDLSSAQVLETLHAGLQSAEHAAFIKHLEIERQRES